MGGGKGGGGLLFCPTDHGWIKGPSSQPITRTSNLLNIAFMGSAFFLTVKKGLVCICIRKKSIQKRGFNPFEGMMSQGILIWGPSEDAANNKELTEIAFTSFFSFIWHYTTCMCGNIVDFSILFLTVQDICSRPARQWTSMYEYRKVWTASQLYG